MVALTQIRILVEEGSSKQKLQTNHNGIVYVRLAAVKLLDRTKRTGQTRSADLQPNQSGKGAPAMRSVLNKRSIRVFGFVGALILITSLVVWWLIPHEPSFQGR
jgi:hypothetical protein